MKLGSRLVIGAVAGIVGTMAMTAAMRRLHARLPAAERYPLTPREIVDSAAAPRRAGRPHHRAHFAYCAGCAPCCRADRAAKRSARCWGRHLGSYGLVPALNLLVPPLSIGAGNALMIAVHLSGGLPPRVDARTPAARASCSRSASIAHPRTDEGTGSARQSTCGLIPGGSLPGKLRGGGRPLPRSLNRASPRPAGVRSYWPTARRRAAAQAAAAIAFLRSQRREPGLHEAARRRAGGIIVALRPGHAILFVLQRCRAAGEALALGLRLSSACARRPLAQRFQGYPRPASAGQVVASFSSSCVCSITLEHLDLGS